MSPTVGATAAFTAGLISFLSPCVLPLLPAYLSFMTGMSLAEMSDAGRSLWRVLRGVLLFVVGFTAVFVALGASASVLGGLLNANRVLFSRVAGVVLILLGSVMLGVVRLPFLHGGIDASSLRRFGPWASLALGLAFPFAMGPCAGPVYGAILTLAVDTRSVGAGALLLLVYSIGLAVPFIALSLVIDRASGLLHWLGRRSVLVNRVAGAVLVVMGALMVAGVMDQVGRLLQGIPGIGSIG